MTMSSAAHMAKERKTAEKGEKLLNAGISNRIGNQLKNGLRM